MCAPARFRSRCRTSRPPGRRRRHRCARRRGPGRRAQPRPVLGDPHDALRAAVAASRRRRRHLARGAPGAARSPRCGRSWRSPRPIRGCWTCRVRSVTPYGSNNSRPTSCCWHVSTRGSGRSGSASRPPYSSTRSSPSAAGAEWCRGPRGSSTPRSSAPGGSWHGCCGTSWATRSDTRTARCGYRSAPKTARSARTWCGGVRAPSGPRPRREGVCGSRAAVGDEGTCAGGGRRRARPRAGGRPRPGALGRGAELSASPAASAIPRRRAPAPRAAR